MCVYTFFVIYAKNAVDPSGRTFPSLPRRNVVFFLKYFFSGSILTVFIFQYTGASRTNARCGSGPRGNL